MHALKQYLNSGNPRPLLGGGILPCKFKAIASGLSGFVHFLQLQPINVGLHRDDNEGQKRDNNRKIVHEFFVFLGPFILAVACLLAGVVGFLFFLNCALTF